MTLGTLSCERSVLNPCHNAPVSTREGVILREGVIQTHVSIRWSWQHLRCDLLSRLWVRPAPLRFSTSERTNAGVNKLCTGVTLPKRDRIVLAPFWPPDPRNVWSNLGEAPFGGWEGDSRFCAVWLDLEFGGPGGDSGAGRDTSNQFQVDIIIPQKIGHVLSQNSLF